MASVRSVRSMITNISIVSVFVKNVDESKRFYIDVLGFEAKDDISLGDGYRWADRSQLQALCWPRMAQRLRQLSMRSVRPNNRKYWTSSQLCNGWIEPAGGFTPPADWTFAQI